MEPKKCDWCEKEFDGGEVKPLDIEVTYGGGLSEYGCGAHDICGNCFDVFVDSLKTLLGRSCFAVRIENAKKKGVPKKKLREHIVTDVFANSINQKILKFIDAGVDKVVSEE